MKQSLRARRMAKLHRRNGQQAKLNLVSLMDIFTIIVFFLLMNSSDVEVLQNHKSITLPESVSEQKPESNLVIMINAEELLVAGAVVANVSTELNNSATTIDGLTRVLNARKIPLAAAQIETGADAARAVTIMGDEAVPYALLKKVMTTCTAADYRKISLAVTRIEPGAGFETAARYKSAALSAVEG